MLTAVLPFVSLSRSPFSLWYFGILLILIVNLLSVVFLILALYTSVSSLSKLIVVIDIFGYSAGGTSTIPMEMNKFHSIP